MAGVRSMLRDEPLTARPRAAIAEPLVPGRLFQVAEPSFQAVPSVLKMLPAELDESTHASVSLALVTCLPAMPVTLSRMSMSLSGDPSTCRDGSDPNVEAAWSLRTYVSSTARKVSTEGRSGV